MKNEKEQDQDYLVEELSPTLHQEGTGDFATPMKTVLLRGHLARTYGVFHAGCGSHWILATDANTVEEERPDIANDPTVLRYSPCCCKHDEAEEHNSRILDQAPSATNPITNDAN
jgi:hypothetical protein